ncbi:hypothetical protein [Arthrobacter sp. NPDC056493]|uniref:hypothetical protein n=1 Tax=Arthrobacter sp. NPDC056493 TaxID=3345839 RepID=UPI00366E857D
MEPVHADLVPIALDRADGGSFERFVNSFYPAIVGGNFVPLGGFKDGGADAYETPIHEDVSSAERYYQASIEADVEGKIRRTVARLIEFGRSPKSLVYLSPREVRYVDRVERQLTDELDVTITIRDGNYIQSHVNDGPQTIAAFDGQLRHHTDFLKGVGKSTIVPVSKHVKSPAVYVFLAQELHRQDGDFQLVNAMTDALILWALEDTDPDRGVLRTSNEVLKRIGAQLPGVLPLVERRLSKRLTSLSSKHYPGGRAIRAHQKDGLYCLPFETRKRIEDESASDEALRVQFMRSLEARIAVAPKQGLGPAGARDAAKVANRAIQLSFETQGLEFASFVSRTEGDARSFPTITEAIRTALVELGLTGKRGALIGEAALGALRGVLYESHENERQYLHKLSLTYSLLFTLNAEPRLVEYFQNLAGDFYLYVGSDILIRSLSEYFLPDADQMTRNTLRMAAQHGAKLVLTRPVLEEIAHHLRGCDWDYRSQIAQVQDHLPYEIIRDVPRILLRAYLYAHINQELGMRRPRSWQGYVQQFCDHVDLHSDAVYDDLRKYLCSAFNMVYRSTEDLAEHYDNDEVQRVASALAPYKRNEDLAWNDAILASAVYGRRVQRKETHASTEFGLSTWWLTGETSILRHTKDLVAKHGSRYVMRPDFLLNFLTLAPGAADVRTTYRNVFPSLLGVSLGRRMEAGAFDEVMKQVAEAEQLDDARRSARIAKVVDQLKSHSTKQFLVGADRESALDVSAARKYGDVSDIGDAGPFEAKQA